MKPVSDSSIAKKILNTENDIHLKSKGPCVQRDALRGHAASIQTGSQLALGAKEGGSEGRRSQELVRLEPYLWGRDLGRQAPGLHVD